MLATSKISKLPTNGLAASKKRYRFSLRAPTRRGQDCPLDLAAIAAKCLPRVAATMQDLGIKRVYNADQTGHDVLALILPGLLILHKF